MGESGWLASVLGGVILVLLGIIITDARQRVTKLEDKFDRHDEWAAGQANKLTLLEGNATGVPSMVARIEHRLELLENKLDSIIRRQS